METTELLNRIESIIDESKTAIMATTDSEGAIHMRWMTPVILKNRPGAVFAFSMKDAPKILRIESTGRVEWMAQTRDLREIVNFCGRARVVDNPALKAELIDAVGSGLFVFWKANAALEEFVVIETVIEQATYFKPMEAEKETITIEEPAKGK